MERKVQIMDEKTVSRSLARITHEIIERNNGAKDICILGIKNRGIDLAKTIKENIEKFDGTSVPLGTIDVTLHRDDISKEEKLEKASQSDIPFNIADKTVIIVDDVLYTGRTARAALEAVFSIGRPKAVQFVALVDRGHREIPIRPDFVGKNIPTSKHEKVVVVLDKGQFNGVFIVDKENV